MSASADDWNQNARLLRLTTPLGANALLAEQFCAVESLENINEVCRVEITALSTDAHLKLKQLMGQAVLLELLTSESRDQLRPFHGHVTEVEFIGANGGLARYRIVFEPWLAFLRYRRDSKSYQDMNVLDILDSVFRYYESQGTLVPKWRHDIADASIYSKRSLTTQYQETDLAFVQRLMNEEGLFAWLEHQGDTQQAPFGSHTLVIADHNGAFKANAQSQITFTQAGTVLKEDSIDRWRSERRWQTNEVNIVSWDYRQLDTRPVAAQGAADKSSDQQPLTIKDAPGVYSYENRTHGQNIALRQMQAIEAHDKIFTGAGTVRTLSPATSFTLSGHPDDEGGDNADFLIIRVVHQAHNNLSADLQAQVNQCLGKVDESASIQASLENPYDLNELHHNAQTAGERPLYRNRLDAIRSKIPYRSLQTDGHGRLLHPKPTVYGQQTAIVVGPPGNVIYTDRDHRIKVQFHWQRATTLNQSHSRLTHPQTEGHTGAPGNEQSGTWVRVATPLAPIASANWGSNAIPRIGQEVLIDFIDGDIDRPVVIGSLYNGIGLDNAQQNKLTTGVGSSTGNAPAWFPGTSGGHAHAASLSGIKTQAMASSQQGAGSYNQLVFDDSPGESRTSLQQHALPHQGNSELNLGHLRHQTDNQRLNYVGFGAELKTQFSAAVRAGQGLLISSDARTQASSSQLDSREAQSQAEQSHGLQLSLAETAQKHRAKLKDEKQKEEPPAKDLPAIKAHAQSIAVLQSTAAGHGDGSIDAVYGRAGGQGKVTAYSEPQLQISSPAGIAATTPRDMTLNAGNTSSLVASHDLNFSAQANLAHAVKAGISVFTYGKLSKDEHGVENNGTKPNKETGIRLHTATGKVSTQSQSDQTNITADKNVTVNSITQSIMIAAPRHVLMTAMGAYLKLEGGNIMIHGPGTMLFRASMKELTGPMSSTPALPHLPKPDPLQRAIELNFHYDDLEPVKAAPYKVTFADGTSRQGKLNAKGYARLENVPPGDYHVEYGEDERPWKAPALTPDPYLHNARQKKQEAQALIDAAHKKHLQGDAS
ncbi:MAG: type VI secretion system tip protein VgrG [Burkholderiales bacterium]|nr:type VI secretion system tip protein VgrG [Burkholderiales bacterium]